MLNSLAAAQKYLRVLGVSIISAWLFRIVASVFTVISQDSNLRGWSVAEHCVAGKKRARHSTVN